MESVQAPARRTYAVSVAIVLLAVAATGGCTRGFYRQQADGEVYSLLETGMFDPRWKLDRYTLPPDPRSRLFDPNCPDFPPMPPDDPTSHQLMHCVDCKKGWPCWHRNGDTPFVENPFWQAFIPYGPDGEVGLSLEEAVKMGLVHSRDYQLQLEELYLSALDVTFERFRFDTQFFARNSTFFTTQGRVRGGGQSRSILRTDTDLEARKLFSTGGDLVVGVANSLVWQFSGPDQFTPNTVVDFTFVQPLLRFAGRERVMERLTLAERTLLGNIRAMQRYRQGFFVQIATGRNPGQGPTRRGGFFGGPGLEAFTGVGAGGFGRAGAGGGGGGGGGFAGGAGAAQVGGYLGLLQDQRQIENRRANVAGLRQSLELLEALFEANRIDRLQVDLARQALFNAQSQLITAEAAYQASLDNFKVTLGLPPHLPVEVEDDLLDEFELLAPEMIDLQQDSAQLLARLWAAPAEAEGERAFAAQRAELARSAEILARALEALRIARYLVPPGENPLAPLRERFTLYESRLAALREQHQRLLKIMDQLESFPPAMQMAEQLEREALELLPEVEQSLETLESRRQERIETLRRLARNEVVTSGKVDRQAFEVDEFLRRVENLPESYQQMAARLAEPLDRWDRYAAELVSRRAAVAAHADLLEQLLAPLGEVVERLQQQLAQPDQTEPPEELNEFLAQLNRLTEDPGNLAGRVEQGLRDLERLLEAVAEDVVVLTDDAADMGLLQARIRLEAAVLVPVDLRPATALAIASHNRLDWMNARATLVDTWRLIEFNADPLQSDLSIVFSGELGTLGQNPVRFRDPTGQLRAGIQFDAPITRLGERNTYRQALIEYQQAQRSYVNFVDLIERQLRNTLRTIELNEVNFELRRAAVQVAIDQVELARLRLQEPPRPGEQPTLGATTARDLVSALSDLLQVQNDYLSVWVNYQAQRLDLDLDLGTMELDEHGIWIDPGRIDESRFTCGEYDEVDAPPQPPVPPELVPPPPEEEEGPLDGEPELLPPEPDQIGQLRKESRLEPSEQNQDVADGNPALRLIPPKATSPAGGWKPADRTARRAGD